MGRTTRPSQKPKEKTTGVVWLEELTWPEAKKAVMDGKVFIVPIGAAAKEHGPHLPLNTDLLLARELLTRASVNMPFVAAPLVTFGYYPAFVNYPGTLTISDILFYDTVKALISQLIGFGVKRIVILNTGVSTRPELQKVVRWAWSDAGIEVSLVNDMEMSSFAAEALELSDGGSHADMVETSLVMAIDPTVVRLSQLETARTQFALNAPTIMSSPIAMSPTDATSPCYSPSGVLGDPTGANAEFGNKFLDAMTSVLIRAIQYQASRK